MFDSILQEVMTPIFVLTDGKPFTNCYETLKLPIACRRISNILTELFFHFDPNTRKSALFSVKEILVLRFLKFLISVTTLSFLKSLTIPFSNPCARSPSPQQKASLRRPTSAQNARTFDDLLLKFSYLRFN